MTVERFSTQFHCMLRDILLRPELHGNRRRCTVLHVIKSTFSLEWRSKLVSSLYSQRRVKWKSKWKKFITLFFHGESKPIKTFLVYVLLAAEFDYSIGFPVSRPLLPLMWLFAENEVGKWWIYYFQGWKLHDVYIFLVPELKFLITFLI